MWHAVVTGKHKLNAYTHTNVWRSVYQNSVLRLRHCMYVYVTQICTFVWLCILPLVVFLSYTNTQCKISINLSIDFNFQSCVLRWCLYEFLHSHINIDAWFQHIVVVYHTESCWSTFFVVCSTPITCYTKSLCTKSVRSVFLAPKDDVILSSLKNLISVMLWSTLFLDIIFLSNFNHLIRNSDSKSMSMTQLTWKKNMCRKFVLSQYFESSVNSSKISF